MYVLERRALLTLSRYCGISSASRLEMATESSEGFMMHALPGSRKRGRGRSPHSTSMAWIKGKGRRKKSPQHINGMDQGKGEEEEVPTAHQCTGCP